MYFCKTIVNFTRFSCQLLLVLSPALCFPQFSPANVVLLQVGNGSGPLANTGNQVILKEYSPSGQLTFSVLVPTTINPLLIGGTAVSEGGLSLTPDGKFLVFAGYASNLTYTGSLSAASALTVNRGIGVVDLAGNYVRVAVTSSFYSGNSIRSATSDGNDNYWAAGGNAAANYFGSNFPAATIQSSVTNARNVIAFNGDLYFSTASGTPGIYRVGSGYPVNSGQTCSLVINAAGTVSGTPSPYAFYFNAGHTICYVADDRNAANNGGIQKWVLAGGTFTLAYVLGTASAYGARGVIADFSGSVPMIFATSSEGSLNRLVAISDQGPGSTATVLATAMPNTIFRGIAFSPFCSTVQCGPIGMSGTACAGQAFTLTAPVSGTGPLTYSWTGPAGYSANQQSISPIAGLSGTFSVVVANGCSSSANSISVTVNPLPPITVSTSTVCTGGTATLAASGAAAYKWSNGDSTALAFVSPAVNTVYTVTGQSSQGCYASATTTVTVVSSLSMTVNSPVFCVGDSAVLNASGAMVYSWSTGAGSSSITVAPMVNTQYTVSGSAAGCSVAAIAISTVVVNPLPVVSVSAENTVCCNHDGPISIRLDPPGGNLFGTGITGNTFSPYLVQPGTFLASYSYTDANGCVNADSLVVLVDLCVGFRGDKKPQLVHTRSDAMQDLLLIDTGNPSSIARCRLISLCGTLCDEFECRGNCSINLVAYPPGIYLLNLCCGNEHFNLKFIKD